MLDTEFQNLFLGLDHRIVIFSQHLGTKRNSETFFSVQNTEFRHFLTKRNSETFSYFKSRNYEFLGVVQTLSKGIPGKFLSKVAWNSDGIEVNFGYSELLRNNFFLRKSSTLTLHSSGGQLGSICMQQRSEYKYGHNLKIKNFTQHCLLVWPIH